jgi:hypothetical protein
VRCDRPGSARITTSHTPPHLELRRSIECILPRCSLAKRRTVECEHLPRAHHPDNRHRISYDASTRASPRCLHTACC